MHLLVVDTETTSADPTAAALVEIAFALYDTTTRGVLYSFSMLTPGHCNGQNAAADINNISEEMLAAAATAFAKPAGDVYSTVINASFASADYYLAYNAEYDSAILSSFQARPWICARKDLKFPRQGTGQKLAYLAADHGIATPSAHRAMSDVLTLVSLLQLLPDLEQQILEARKPRATYIALVSYEKRDQAKLRGFSWHAPSKEWIRTMTEEQYAAVSADCPFRIRRAVFQASVSGGAGTWKLS